MRNSGTEPSSVILSQKSILKSWKEMSQTYQNKLKPKRDGVIKPQKLQFQSILTRKILMLSNATNQAEVDRWTWLHVPSGTHWSTSSDTHQVVEI